MTALRTWFIQRFTPLQQLLVMGGLLRLASVLFSKGFGWHDDHFLIVEAAQSWADGSDYNYWLPSSDDPNRQPQGHPLLYTGLHFVLFKFLNVCGLHNPQGKMLVVRFLHAVWSLLIINYGYKIALRHGGAKPAWYAGIFLAFFWFMPFMSVRNLVEFVCVPLCLGAIYRAGKTESTLRDFLLAGLLLGLAFSIRFQSLFITAGIGLGLLLLRTPVKKLFALGAGFLLVLIFTQGLVDYVLWKRPFAEFMAYVQYNVDNAGVYGTDNWHMYFDLTFGLLIPPLSFLLVAGYLRNWKKLPLLFWPVLVYFAFHTYFPNKQERFIMTILPLIVIAGTCGMFDLHAHFHQKINAKLFVASKWFVIVLNLILLPILTLSYSKRHRVEAMYYLYQKNDSNNFFVEDSNKENDFLMPPLFYYGKWVSVYGINKTYTADSALVYYKNLPPELKPGYIVFWQGENIAARVDTLKKRFPSLTYETTIEPSLIDKTLFYLNPLNDNQTAYIYRLGK